MSGTDGSSRCANYPVQADLHGGWSGSRRTCRGESEEHMANQGFPALNGTRSGYCLTAIPSRDGNTYVAVISENT